MPSPLFADRPHQPPERGRADALVPQTRGPRGEEGAARRDAGTGPTDPRTRRRRSPYDPAARRFDDPGTTHPGQPLRGAPERSARRGSGAAGRDGRPRGEEAAGSPPARVGSAEWNLLTDEASWSGELYRIVGRSPGAGPMSLDELPSLVFAEDRAQLTRLLTGCLVDGRPIDGELRIVRPDGRMRTVRVTGGPVLDREGRTASMWAVFRDVGEPRRGGRAAYGPREAPRPAGDGYGAAVLDVAAHHCRGGGRSGGDWYDVLELPDGNTLLTTGGLMDRGAPAASAAMLLGALRGLAVAGILPGASLGHLDRLARTAAPPVLGSVLCCRYDPATRTLRWARAGGPAPLLFRDGTGRALDRPEGAPLGTAASDGPYEQAEVRLRPGDLLLLRTGGPAGGGPGPDTGAPGTGRLLALAAEFARARNARDCVRRAVEALGGTGRADGPCVVAAGVGGPP
ncbi:SpoIIE family protein phosphatase [Streptomyces sudanensis]|uniref:SpoIIE family protein phosphatase n=2 Tax=Streptomyces sudanensis TaxID=436397 RepID=UPI0020CEC8E0|nr:SpoIIE family protein phosphatase [Streptomyces sudanensis]MCP9960093.1 SpoIIE family protein phosphatase [Streptomyces sudanensis]